MPKNYLLPIEGHTFDTSTITADYQPINPGGLPEPCSILRLINFSNIPIAISYDGETDNDAIIPLSMITLNAQTNAQPNGNVALFKKGTVVWVSSSVVGNGEIILAGYYQGA